MNRFADWAEWIPVVAAAFGLAFLTIAIPFHLNRRHITVTAWVMAAQNIVGVLRAGPPVQSILHGPSESLLANAIHAAPLFAPLLFADLAILGDLGLWCVWSTSPHPAAE